MGTLCRTYSRSSGDSQEPMESESISLMDFSVPAARPRMPGALCHGAADSPPSRPRRVRLFTPGELRAPCAGRIQRGEAFDRLHAGAEAGRRPAVSGSPRSSCGAPPDLREPGPDLSMLTANPCRGARPSRAGAGPDRPRRWGWSRRPHGHCEPGPDWNRYTGGARRRAPCASGETGRRARFRFWCLRA